MDGYLKLRFFFPLWDSGQLGSQRKKNGLTDHSALSVLEHLTFTGRLRTSLLKDRPSFLVHLNLFIASMKERFLYCLGLLIMKGHVLKLNNHNYIQHITLQYSTCCISYNFQHSNTDFIIVILTMKINPYSIYELISCCRNVLQIRIFSFCIYLFMCVLAA